MSDPKAATSVDLDSLEALSKAATPGEWRAGAVDTDCVFGDVNNPELMAPHFGRVLLKTNHHFPTFEADARFIAAANPSAVLALITELRELRAMRVAVHDLAECALGRGNPLPPALDFDLREIERLTR